jgi:adenylate cyclase
MERIWQRVWHWFGPRYSWAVCAICFLTVLQTYLLASFVVVAFEKSGAYIEAAPGR